MKRYRVQNLVMPNFVFGAPEDMYVRFHDRKVMARTDPARLIFTKGGTAYTDTFFNALNLNLWQGHCRLDDLFLVLKGHGTFVIRVGVHRLDISHRFILEREVALNPDVGISIQIPWRNEYDDGILYTSMSALSDGELHGGQFETTTTPQRGVKLGIVVTHFNRVRYVTDAVMRLQDQLFADPYYQDKIQLVVVDNSRNISVESDDHVTVLPNDNFGGAGGFTRGLLYLQDQGSATHCLFMDDDASCEVESICRTLHILEFARVGRLAVAGALLRENEPYRLHEKGGSFRKGKLYPQKHGLDMRNVNDLLLAESNQTKVDYGAWWHFAFALDDVRHYAYPFFVRGDDVLFSLQNDLKIVTLNGVASWGEDFTYKESPMTRYLAVRSEMVLALRSPAISKWDCAKGLLKSHGSSLFSYNYASAHAVTMAVQDVLKGPAFWPQNLDAAEPRARVAAVAQPEKMLPLDIASFDVQLPRSHETRPRKLFRWLTLNGILIPKRLMKNATVKQPKNFRAVLREVFGYTHILYYYPPLRLGYVAEHDKRKFVKEVRRFLPVLLQVIRRHKELHASYVEATTSFTARIFWENVYAMKPKTVDTVLDLPDHSVSDSWQTASPSTAKVS